MLRERGVVSKFVEFFGPGLHTLGLADRATIGNMSPEFGSTCAIFPVDRETLRYLEFTGRPTETIELVDAYAREQGMFHDEDSEDPTFSETLELDLVRGRAVDRRPEAPPGPDRARGRQAGVPRVAGRVRPRRRRRRSATPATRRSRSRSRPPTRRPRTTTTTRGRPHVRSRPSSGEARAAIAEREATPVPVTLEDGDRDRARPRPGRDRGDHQLHQHLQPLGDDRRRPARPEGGRARARAQAVGEDLARARIDRGHRLPRARRPRRVPRPARLQPRRLRLHDLHRQLRPAAGGDLDGGQRQRPRRLRGALGQPQLRGPDPARTCATTTSPRRRSASPTRSPGAWTST